jgi:hypothetical protein
MDHKIVSEYDRIRGNDDFPEDPRLPAEWSSYGASKSPRFWLPRKALALAALVLMLTTLAAALWPGSFDRILHRNRDISQIGVPVGVPEASAAPIAPSPGASIPAQTNVAQQNNPPANPATSPVISTDQSNQIAANNQESEPEPPAAGPDDSAAPTSDAPATQPAVAENANAAAVNSNDEVATESASSGNEQSNGAAVESKVVANPKPAESTTKRRSPAISRRTRIAQTRSYGYDDGLPPVRPGTFRARVIGETPDGRVVLALPSGRTAIVDPPRRRMRPIPIERRDRFMPPFQPFAPAFPPVD